MKVGARIGGMRKILIPALVLAGLIGCNQWDEVAERAVCNNAFPRNSTKAQACYDGRKLPEPQGGAMLRATESGPTNERGRQGGLLLLLGIAAFRACKSAIIAINRSTVARSPIDTTIVS
jgi:hypothetical protein